MNAAVNDRDIKFEQLNWVNGGLPGVARGARGQGGPGGAGRGRFIHD